MPQDREIKNIKAAVYRAAYTEAQKAERKKKDKEYAATPEAKARRKAARSRDLPQKVLPDGACNTSMFAELIGMNLYEARLILKMDNIDFPEAMEKVRYRSTIYLMTDVVAWIASHAEWLEARKVRAIRVYQRTHKPLSFYENSIKFKDIFASKYDPKAITMNKLANKVSIPAVTTRVSFIGVYL